MTRILPAAPASEPPSHPALSRDPDHDPATCRICNPVSSPPPFAMVFGDSLRPTDSAPTHRLPAAGPVSVKVKDPVLLPAADPEMGDGE